MPFSADDIAVLATTTGFHEEADHRYIIKVPAIRRHISERSLTHGQSRQGVGTTAKEQYGRDQNKHLEQPAPNEPP